MDVNPHIANSWHKVNGKVFVIESTGNSVQVVIVKTGKNPRHIRFWCGRYSACYERALALKEGERIKCRFYIRSTLRNGYWNTDLELKDFSEWKKNENVYIASKKAEERKQDTDKNLNLFAPDPNEWLNNEKDKD